MRARFIGKAAGMLVVAAGLVAGMDQRTRTEDNATEDSGFERRVTVADCTFERNPDRFLVGLRRHMEQLSVRTERVVSRRAAQAGYRESEEPVAAPAGNIPSRNYIDDHIFGKMQEDGIPHAPLSSDAEFLRRATLDLTGRIPTADRVRAFLDDENPKKRSNLVAELTASPEFVDKWTMWLGDLLKNTSIDSFVNRYPENRNAFYQFIKDSVESGMPYDEFVRRVISGRATDSRTVGEAMWVVGGRTPMGPVQDTFDTLASRTATQFLGLGNLDCILCHDGKGHLEKLNLWATGVKRSEAWGLSAFFARTQTRLITSGTNPSTYYYWTVTDATTGNYNLNTTSGNRTPRSAVNGSNTAPPKYLFSSVAPSGTTYREQLGNYVIRDRQFARAAVNYLWREMMGLGIVEPTDQFDLSRLDPGADLPLGWTVQPSHPALLEALADDFINNQFNLRHVLSKIAGSSAYQLSSRFNGEWKVEYTAYFARKFTRRLWAEEVHDSIAQATNVLGSYTPRNYTAPIQWAMQLPEPGNNEPANNRGASDFLNYFMRGNRDQNLRSDDATILQALHMMNNNFVVTRIRNSNTNSRVNKLVADRSFSDERVIEELFLHTLSRFPSKQELTAALAALKTNRTQGIENLQWTLLNKIDFLYNY